MALRDTVLRPPSYGWQNPDGSLVVPTNGQIVREFLSRINVFADRRNWLALTSWISIVVLAPIFIVFFAKYFTWPLFAVGFVYSMVLMGSHGTVWLHRYSTHQAFKFSHPIWRFITRNLVMKMVPEEIYVVSHFVHHAKSDEPGDPYNPGGGFLYCFLADAIHQPIALDMSEEDYAAAVKLVAHTGIYTNTYEQYKYWGSIAHPLRLWLHRIGNWSFWYGAFFLIGGHALATCILASSLFWIVGVRTFNYGAHGSGKGSLQKDGEDFYRKDLSINQLWPGIVAGEWHNNHHLFPQSARSGYKSWQIDFPYYYIRLLHAVGGITKYHDSKKAFLAKYWDPYRAEKAGGGVPSTVPTGEAQESADATKPGAA
ncbi:MAG: fatty acid desaturase [Deltaproteobacteria bacterium]|nr:fatty acid desaturase [Deltaproteobacteria bacterium]